MASRLKAPGSSRLVRPGGLKALGAGQPAGVSPQHSSHSATRRTVQSQSVPHVQPTPPNQAPVSGPSSQLEVGDKVLVGGVKPGTVAFLGPTQFAKGVWAGLVLDTPEGKNDGSVAGVSYFQCAPNHGLFARPEKLTRLQKHLPPSAAAMPTPSQPGGYEEGFSIGDRVLVDGVKTGVVEFVGPTQFAKGMWVGIALDVPEGKNNGIVAGVQYFDCKPLHGIFTRPTKLTLVERALERRPPPAAVAAAQRVRAVASEPGPIRHVPARAPGTKTYSVEELKAKAEDMHIGDRVVVSGVKTGRVCYIGQTDFAKGMWVGVELDGPDGKNDGSVSGKRYVYELCNASI